MNKDSKTTKWKDKYKNGAIFDGDRLVARPGGNAGSTFSPEPYPEIWFSREDLELVIKAVNFYREHHNGK